MRSGELRDRLIIQKATITQSDSGAVSESWSTVATVWGAVDHMRGTELWRAQQVQPEGTYKVCIRYRSMRPEYRILAPVQWTTLSAGINAAATSIPVSAAFTASDRGFRIGIESELLAVTAGFETTSMTAARAADGTTAAIHASGISVVRYEELNIIDIIDVNNRGAEVEMICKGAT